MHHETILNLRLIGMCKWKKIKTKVKEVKSKLELFSINKLGLSPTKLKKGIMKKIFYKDIRFYIISLHLISLFVGFCLYFSQRNNFLFNYSIVQTLIGWVFGFFTLSISIYALILKFTKSTTLSIYIQKNVKVKSITIIFSMIYQYLIQPTKIDSLLSSFTTLN